jgi:hypothetical protein
MRSASATHDASARSAGERDVHAGDDAGDRDDRLVGPRRPVEGEGADLVHRPVPPVEGVGDVLDDRGHVVPLTIHVDPDQRDRPRRAREPGPGERCQPGRAHLVAGARVQVPLHDHAVGTRADDDEVVRLVRVDARLVRVRQPRRPPLPATVCPATRDNERERARYAGFWCHISRVTGLGDERRRGSVPGDGTAQATGADRERDAVRHRSGVADDRVPVRLVEPGRPHEGQRSLDPLRLVTSPGGEEVLGRHRGEPGRDVDPGAHVPILPAMLRFRAIRRPANARNLNMDGGGVGRWALRR